MNSIIYLLLFYLLVVLKASISPFVFSNLIGSSFILAFIGFIYKLILIALDKNKYESVELDISYIISEFAKQILIMTTFELLPPAIPVFALFIMTIWKNISKVLSIKEKSVFSKFHFTYLFSLQLILFIITILSFPVGNVNRLINLLKFKDFVSLSIFIAIIASDYILNSKHLVTINKTKSEEPLLVFRYNTNQLIGSLFATIYAIYKEAQNKRLINYLNYKKYLYGQLIFSNLVYMFAVGFIFHLLNDLLLILSLKLKKQEKQKPVTTLSAGINPLESRLILKVPMYKHTKFKEIYKDTLFMPSIFLLFLELLNDILVLIYE